MARDNWPPLSVRRWRQVLAMRDPSWGSEAEDYDDIRGAAESRRMHELRGVIVGQVAEIENLLIFIADQIPTRVAEIPRRSNQRVRPAGMVLTDVELQLRALALEGEFAASIQEIRQVIVERNAIVHAVVEIGYADLPWGRDSVISALWDNNGHKWKVHECEDIEECPHEPEDFDDWSWDISEFRLEKQLNHAYEALGRCVDIWMRLDEILPLPESSGT